jgi:hypothetical protein
MSRSSFATTLRPAARILFIPGCVLILFALTSCTLV